MIKNRYKVLLVEDEPDIRHLVATLLESSGYQAIVAGSGTAAMTLYASYLPDLIIMNLGLPDMDGMKLLEHVRRKDPTPIIVLSARSSEQDKVTALDMGANDYVTKPFSSAELMARVRAALRSARGGAAESRLPGGRFALKDLMIDYDARQIFLKGEEIKLTQTEYNIVALLAENCGKMMTYAAVIRTIWGESAHSGSIKKLQVNVANIRRKLGEKPGGQNYIANEPGVGYRLNE